MRPGLWLLAAALLLSSGACDRCKGALCGACLPPIQLVVTDAVSGGAVADLIVEGAAATCAEDAASAATLCSVQREDPGEDPAGTYDLRLSAPGYEARSLSPEVAADEAGGCCSCGYLATNVDVDLVPL